MSMYLSKLNPKEKREVRSGIALLPNPITMAQAKRWGEQNMPRDLKRTGFICVVGASDEILHGGLWWRINYTKP